MIITEKLKLIRKIHNLSQDDFAGTIGISRSNYANIELGNVAPTKMFINCISLMYNIDKQWLTDDDNDDLSSLNSTSNISSIIAERYSQLDDRYRNFVDMQINKLLEIQLQENPGE